jgi:hypothetical protein
VLVLRVDDARGVVRIQELDEVLADVMRGAGELIAQRLVLPGLEVRAAHLVFPHPDVRGEEVHVRVEVAHVQAEGVLARQLADGVQ